jgi:hypothetical protein
VDELSELVRTSEAPPPEAVGEGPPPPNKTPSSTDVDPGAPTSTYRVLAPAGTGTVAVTDAPYPPGALLATLPPTVAVPPGAPTACTVTAVTQDGTVKVCSLPV